jgi:thiol-disulfide isomerase/thioredoxin
MFYKFIIFIFLVFIGIGYAYWDQVREPSTLDNVIENMDVDDAIAPNIIFRSLEGDSYNLYDFKGKVVLLNFWATWCAPCIAEFPELLNLAKNEQNNVILIAVSVDEKIENIKPFLKRYNLNTKLDNVIIAHDAGKIISHDMFQTSTYPETFILAPDLTIAKKVNGFIEWNSDVEILKLLKDLMK